MNDHKSYFFCGIGGSGMLPLALIVQGRGGSVAGSDRTLDQGKLVPKFDFLRARGIPLFPQDGSGLTSGNQILVASAAVEESVPDVVRARQLGAPRLSRADLLAELFNEAENGIAVGGTSGKSTVTGMIGWILHAIGREPTVMNGAIMKNFVSADQPFASALVGSGPDFVSEVDESDGSISLYRPCVAVLNNVTLDHKSLDELRQLFRDFAGKARTVALNLDDEEARQLAATLPAERLITYSLRDAAADLVGSDVEEEPFAISLTLTERRSGERAPLRLQVPGRHNAENALAAIAAAIAIGVPLRQAADALSGFTGLRRRFERVGSAGGVTVIDDFGHNPDKIAATLRTLHAFPGRLLIFFQPHGFGPLKAMGRELAETFADEMTIDDMLIMSDPIYHGGTTDRSVGSDAVVRAVAERGRHAEHLPDREACADRLVELARAGDRIIVMGARDDTLTLFAEELVARISQS
jgi:UDP-N-acetylmuramate--alanine ligase